MSITMMRKEWYYVSEILLMTDSGSDIDRALAEKYGIMVLPFKYSFDGENYYLDGIDQSTEEFYAMERASEGVPKTAQVTPIEFEEIFEKAYADGYKTVIYTSLSSSASGTYQNACMMAGQAMDEHKDMRIEIIDSKTFTALYGLAVIEGAKLVKAGKSADEVIGRIKKITEGANAVFLTGDLVHLKKGGRINAATLAVANMLDIKPILTIKDGLVVQGGKLRGSKNLFKKLVAAAEEMGDFEKGRVFTVHTCQYEKAAMLRNAIAEDHPNVQIGDLIIGPTIGCHAGPDVLGIVYFSEEF